MKIERFFSFFFSYSYCFYIWIMHKTKRNKLIPLMESEKRNETKWNKQKQKQTKLRQSDNNKITTNMCIYSICTLVYTIQSHTFTIFLLFFFLLNKKKTKKNKSKQGCCVLQSSLYGAWISVVLFFFSI